MTQTAAIKNKKLPLSQGKPVSYTAKTANSGSNFSFHYYGARYLDTKTSRWLSTDPALGEYVPVAPLGENERRHNQNLPNGGIYNIINFHIFNYANNNPVKYIDPDGETPRSHRISDGYYMFSPSISTLEGTVVAVASFTPKVGFAMGTIATGINRLLGYRTIDTNTIRESIMKFSGTASDITGGLSTAASLLGQNSRGLGILSGLLNGINLYFSFSEANQVGMDNLILKYFGDRFLSANSHEGVAFLYAHALSRMCELVENDVISYTTNSTGRITSRRINREAINTIRQELRDLKVQYGLEPIY